MKLLRTGSRMGLLFHTWEWQFMQSCVGGRLANGALVHGVVAVAAVDALIPRVVPVVELQRLFDRAPACCARTACAPTGVTRRWSRPRLLRE